MQLFIHALLGSQCPTDAWLLRTTIRADLFHITKKVSAYGVSTLQESFSGILGKLDATQKHTNYNPYKIYLRFMSWSVQHLAPKVITVAGILYPLSFDITTQEGPTKHFSFGVVVVKYIRGLMLESKTLGCLPCAPPNAVALSPPLYSQYITEISPEAFQ